MKGLKDSKSWKMVFTATFFLKRAIVLGDVEIITFLFLFEIQWCMLFCLQRVITSTISNNEALSLSQMMPRMFGGTETPMSHGGGDGGPRVYCTEDTPGVFSRADSLSSLESCEDPTTSAEARQQV